jgi:N-acetylglucosaminyldiphosphoundecaprenol N-acetyl-beta-D-mannosaminyltransferase
MSIRRRVGNVEFTVMPFPDAVTTLLEQAANITHAGHPGISVHFANAYNVALARDARDYADLLNASDYVFSDGVPITWIGKRAYPRDAAIWERVYGPDVMTAVFHASQPNAPRHYLLGSTPEVIDALTRSLTVRFPQATIVGAESPPFTSPTAPELAARDARIRESGATMVWVGLGTPKQDHEVHRLAASLPVLSLAVGAAFDFLAGTKPQAPVWVQRNGLEWAYRFAKEPTRLGKRYVWGNSVFLLEAARTLKAPRHQG